MTAHKQTLEPLPSWQHLQPRARVLVAAPKLRFPRSLAAGYAMQSNPSELPHIFSSSPSTYSQRVKIPDSKGVTAERPYLLWLWDLMPFSRGPPNSSFCTKENAVGDNKISCRSNQRPMTPASESQTHQALVTTAAHTCHTSEVSNINSTRLQDPLSHLERQINHKNTCPNRTTQRPGHFSQSQNVQIGTLKSCTSLQQERPTRGSPKENGAL